MKNVSNTVFELVENNKTDVVIKVKSNNNLVIARHPYISSDMDYISVTKGKKHILTVIKTDGKTYSFHWGEGGHTLISENTERLKCAVIDFIQNDCKIILEYDGFKVDTAELFYNDYFKAWELILRHSRGYACMFFKDVNCTSEAIDKASEYIMVVNWHNKVYSDGVYRDVWESNNVYVIY